MKNILSIIILIFVTSCSWNYKNGDIKNNIDTQEVLRLEQELLALEETKAKELLEKIELENEIASEVLQNFLSSEDFDIKAEIERTKQKYGDTLGPILEYEHERIKQEETNSGSTQTGSTNTGMINTGSLNIIDEDNINQTGGLVNTGSIVLNVENDEKDDRVETKDTDIYSGEVIIGDSDELNNQEDKDNLGDNIEISTQDEIISIEDESDEKVIKENIDDFIEVTKVGKSGSYTMFKGQGETCNGGLQMTKNDGTKSWLFTNNCEQKIYDFTLAVGGINVFYSNAAGTQGEQFIALN